MTRIDWDLIRDDFVKGTDDYGVLAKKHGISRQSIELKASPKNEHWQLLRQQYREQFEGQVQSQTLTHSVVKAETEAELLPALPASVVPGASLSFTDIDALVNGAIARLYSQIQLTEARSLEKTAEVFAQLIDLKLRLAPPTIELWASLAMQFKLSARELFDEIKRLENDH